MSEQVQRRPSKKWVGKILTAKQDMTVPVFTGSDIPVAEILDGQRVKVVGIREDGWLECRILNDVFFRGEDGSRIHTKDLLVGVHPQHDLDKFQVRRKLREQTADVPEPPEGFEPHSEEEIRKKAIDFAASADEDRIEAMLTNRRASLTLYQAKGVPEAAIQRQRKLIKIAELALQIKRGEELAEPEPEQSHIMLTMTVDTKHVTPEIVRAIDDVVSEYSADLSKPQSTFHFFNAEDFKLARAILKQRNIPWESLQEQEQEPQPAATRDVVAIARSWIKVKGSINELNMSLSRLTVQSKDLESQLLGVVRELVEHQTRIDKIVIALQRVKRRASKKWFESALEMLEGINREMTIKVKKLHEETQEYVGWLMLEQDKLIQAYSWASNFSKRIRHWLGRVDRKITALEQLVFYSG